MLLDNNFFEDAATCHNKLYRKIKFFYSPTDAKVIFLKTILKFALKQLRHVSVQSHHHQGAHYSHFLKLQLLK